MAGRRAGRRLERFGLDEHWELVNAEFVICESTAAFGTQPNPMLPFWMPKSGSSASLLMIQLNDILR
jgi:hypothetical protein